MSVHDASASRSGAVAIVAVGAVLALVISVSALVLAAGGDEASGGRGLRFHPRVADRVRHHPAHVTVAAGGTLHVANDGSTAHNLSVVDQDLTTPDIAAGEAARARRVRPRGRQLRGGVPDLRPRGLGHDRRAGGRRRRFGRGHRPAAATGDPAPTTDHSAHEYTEADYAEMTEAMNDTIAPVPRRDRRDSATPSWSRPRSDADGTKVFDLTAAITPWEVAPGQGRRRLDLQRRRPGPQIHVDVGDRVEITAAQRAARSPPTSTSTA